MELVGKRANWSTPITSSRPRDILGLSLAAEANISQFIGWSGADQDDNAQEQFILVYNGTTAPTLTDYATTPIGTVILTPQLASVSHYIHQAQSATPVKGDWKVVAAATAA